MAPIRPVSGCADARRPPSRLVVVFALSAGFAPAAQAAGPDSLTITGGDLGDGNVTVKQAEKEDLFGRVLTEVSWLANATPQTSAPKKDALGPKYTITLSAGDKAQQVYDLYPLAKGGPRAYRPAKQPSGKKAEGWFYGRLTMRESLRVSGVPLEEKPDVVSGGIGGAVGEEVEKKEFDAVAGANKYLDDVQRLFLLNGAVLVIVLGGLAGVAFLIRRRV